MKKSTMSEKSAKHTITSYIKFGQNLPSQAHTLLGTETEGQPTKQFHPFRLAEQPGVKSLKAEYRAEIQKYQKNFISMSAEGLYASQVGKLQDFAVFPAIVGKHA